MVFKYCLDVAFFCVLGLGGIEKEGDMPSFVVYCLEFACEVEADVFKAFLSHRQHVS